MVAMIPQDTSKNLLRVALLSCDARCTARTAALLEQHRGRPRRFFEVPRRCKRAEMNYAK
jgi:hypothetical protein